MLAGLGKLSFVARQLLLVATMAVVALVIVPWAYLQAGWSGLVTALVAGGVCCVCSCVCLGLFEILRKRQQVLEAMLAGMILRMGLPLGLCLLARAAGQGVWKDTLFGEMSRAGLIYYVLSFYLATLAAETLLVVAVTQNPEAGGRRLSEPMA